MICLRNALCVLAAFVSYAPLAAFAAITNPTPQRAYVSLSGLDTNNCGPTAPCRTFAMALTQVNADGEILVLDSGGYGTMTITQGVTITAPPGVYAGMSVFPGLDGITIDAAGAKVVLDGIHINGQGGTNGINVVDVGSLQVKNCVVANMSGAGLYVVNPSSGNYIAIGVTDSQLDNNGNGISLTGKIAAMLDGVRTRSNTTDGVSMADGVSATIINSTTSGNARNGFYFLANVSSSVGTISHSVASRNGNGGVLLEASVTAGIATSMTVVDSLIEANGYSGIGSYEPANTGVLTKLTVEHSTISKNVYYGILASNSVEVLLAHNLIDRNDIGVHFDSPGGTLLTLAENTITQNGTGLEILGNGVAYTRGDNTIIRNTTNNNTNHNSGVPLTPWGGM